MITYPHINMIMAINLKKVSFHLISENTCNSVISVTNTALLKFTELDVSQYHWPMIRTEDQMKEAFAKIQNIGGIVIYTVQDDDLRKLLKQLCHQSKILCISAVSQIVNGISKYFGVEKEQLSNYSNKFDDRYFDKIDAIDFTIRHDDGQLMEEIDEADIILLGASRTSKTPTSVYLAYNGFKTANVPIIYNMPISDYVTTLKNRAVFGLLINPHQLTEIRQSRLNLSKGTNIDNYVDTDIIKQECNMVRKLCEQNGWQIIDVSLKSIEETAALIMKNYYDNLARD